MWLGNSCQLEAGLRETSHSNSSWNSHIGSQQRRWIRPMLEVYCTVRHKIWTAAFGLVFCVLLSDHLLQKCISKYRIPDWKIDLSTFMWHLSCWAVKSTPLFLAPQQLNLLPTPTLCLQLGDFMCFCAVNHCLELSNLCCNIWKGGCELEFRRCTPLW